MGLQTVLRITDPLRRPEADPVLFKPPRRVWAPSEEKVLRHHSVHSQVLIRWVLEAESSIYAAPGGSKLEPARLKGSGFPTDGGVWITDS